MFPPIYEVCAANSEVKAALGTPVRLYPFGEAPHGVALPYAVWQTLGGSPENYLKQRPDIDQFSLQVDVYATSATAARNVARALRNAIEPVAYITRWNGEDRDQETKNYRVSFDVDWWVQR
ncbi:DUF3168 domain-containing protein [Pseudomonas sp. NY15436]|uniref:DUF3168 domain-containing protein n=1 Tax=Pseudomonas sp. NY15436 TaxID=3400359 RepID=UPI003A835B7F